ncbi:hypothetical protein NIIDMKKI_63980 [Mycobacterium kansasii]|uniref:Uncharacterized protein n=1 Tax=Mycobacterium kansasii TaxID=1768 RepID=A0A7G1IMD3_MYCKA|nr:hypothetical protein NIIDMKKI_63980 [Mycobacterium kansasii]
MPFHYGYWDAGGDRGHHRAANELTLTDWDPVSKQPIYKTAAARLRRLRAGTGGASSAPTTAASAPVDDTVHDTAGGAAARAAEALVSGGAS